MGHADIVDRLDLKKHHFDHHEPIHVWKMSKKYFYFY